MKFKELLKGATKSDVGKQVFVFPGPGEDPILGIIHSVDELTGYVLEVVIKDADKKEKILAVKDMIIQRLDQLYGYLPFLKELFILVKGIFIRVFGKNKDKAD